MANGEPKEWLQKQNVKVNIISINNFISFCVKNGILKFCRLFG